MNEIVSKIKRVIAVIEPQYQDEPIVVEGHIYRFPIGLSEDTLAELSPLAADIWAWATGRGYHQFLLTEPEGATALNIPGGWVEIGELDPHDGYPATKRFYELYRIPAWLDNIHTLARLAEGGQPAIDDADLPMQAEVEGTPRITAGRSEQPAKPKKKRGRNSSEKDNKKFAEEYRRGLEDGEWDTQEAYRQLRHPNKTSAWLCQILRKY